MDCLSSTIKHDMKHGMHLGMLVGRARRVLRREFEARIAEYDLTLPQVHVLRSLWEGDGKSIGELSEMTLSDGPTLTSLLDRMEAKDLIYRERDPSDRRVVRIFLQERGRALHEGVCEAGEAIIGLARQKLSQEQLNQLCDLLMLLCEAMEGSHENGARCAAAECLE